MAKKRLRAWALGALIAMMLVPAGLAAGSGWKSKSYDQSDRTDVVLLVLGKHNYLKWGDQKQAISSKGGCNTPRFAASPDILGFAAGGGTLTLKHDGFGVKGHSAWGCETVDKNESITVTMGAALDTLAMSAIDIDFEVLKKTKIGVSFRFQGSEVASDTFDPKAKKDGENYRYFKRPTNGGKALFFDEVVFTALYGGFAIEGGSDYSKGGKGQIDTRSTASQFEVGVPFDGEITCGDTAEISDPAVETVMGEVTMHAMGSESWQTGACDLKFYNDDVTPDTISFIPFLEGTSARYTMALTVEDQPIVTDNGLIVSLGLTYDPAAGANPTRTLQSCEGQPVLSGEGYDAFWSQADVGLLPPDETACFYEVDLEITGAGVGTELWGIYFEDDPSFGFK